MPRRSRLSSKQLEALEQRLVAGMGEGEVVQLDDLVAEAGGAEVQRQRALASRVFGSTFDESGGLLDASLWLARARRCASAQPGQLLASQVAAGRLGDGGPFFAFGPPGEIGVVATVVHVAASAVELEHAGAHPIEKMAVVGDHDQTASIRGQSVLEPGDGIDVEVVRGLVEDEQIALDHEGAGQRHPLGLTARQRRGVGVDQGPHAHLVEHRLGLPGLGRRGHDRVDHPAGRKGRVLVEHRHPHAAPASEHALLRLRRTPEDAQQGRLPTAVQAHHPPPLARSTR